MQSSLAVPSGDLAHFYEIVPDRPSIITSGGSENGSFSRLVWLRHFPACPEVSHSKSDKSADAGDDALTKGLEREVSDHSYHFRGL